MIEYVYDYLSILFAKLKDRKKIRAVILFGSFARGDNRKDSDIDIFIDTIKDYKKEVEEISKEALNEFELKASRSWHLKGMKNAISLIIDDINLDKWKELKKEISIYGIVLYGKILADEKVENSVLVSYDLSGLKQKNKMKVIRNLYGYTIKKGKKEYIQEGLLSKLKAERMSNAILIGLENYKEVLELLRENKVPVKIKHVSM